MFKHLSGPDLFFRMIPFMGSTCPDASGDISRAEHQLKTTAVQCVQCSRLFFESVLSDMSQSQGNSFPTFHDRIREFIDSTALPAKSNENAQEKVINTLFQKNPTLHEDALKIVSNEKSGMLPTYLQEIENMQTAQEKNIETFVREKSKRREQRICYLFQSIITYVAITVMILSLSYNGAFYLAFGAVTILISLYNVRESYRKMEEDKEANVKKAQTEAEERYLRPIMKIAQEINQKLSSIYTRKA